MKGAASYIRHEEDKKKIEILNMIISKIKTNYIIEPFIENSNLENRKLIVKMRISDHVLEIERGRYIKN
jgi:exosome complex RNA-binding protein Rrp42 (RNase PH superfamily)